MPRKPKVTIKRKAAVVQARLTGASHAGAAIIAGVSKETAKRVWHDPGMRNMFREIKHDFQGALSVLYGKMLDSVAAELDQAMQRQDWARARELRAEIMRIVAAGESMPAAAATGQGAAGQTLDAILRTYAEVTISGNRPTVANGSIIDTSATTTN